MSAGTEQQIERPKGRWRRILVRTLLVLLLFVVLAPTLFSVPLFRNAAFALGLAIGKVNGTLAAGGTSLGWLTDQRVDGIDLRTLDGRQLITLESVSVDRSLSHLLFHPNDIGTVRVDGLHAHLSVTDKGSNFADAFQRMIEQAKLRPPTDLKTAPWRNMSIKVVVKDAGLTWQFPKSTQPWTVDGLNLTAALESAAITASGQPELILERGTVLKDCELTPGMCEDFLKFIAPILANVGSARGKFSIDVNQGRIRLDDLKGGELSGQLTLQTAEVAAGPIIQKIADVLHVPATIQLMRDDVVKFSLRDGRAYHENLEFGLAYFRVRTQGSVGVKDQSLDILADFELQLPDQIMSQRPLLRALGSQPFRVAIKGTLGQPRPEFPALDGILSLLAEAFQNLQPNQPATESKFNAVEQAIQSLLTEGNAAGANVGQAATQAAPVVLDLLNQALERRRQRLAAEQQKQSVTPSTGAPTDPEPPRKRPLERLRDRLREDTPKPDAPPPVTPPPALSPSTSPPSTP